MGNTVNIINVNNNFNVDPIKIALPGNAETKQVAKQFFEMNGTEYLDYLKKSVEDAIKNLPFSPVKAPTPSESTQPSGQLKVKDGVIETAGGYKIEQLGQFDWQITGPDGKSTKIWGDPHVAEGDGGTWDFKKNSTFVLGDGTRINVSTVPYGNGMTVTGGLEVISGNDRVQVTDIDKGKGKVGQVTQDGYAHANSFQGDVFVMGKESDDWSLQGKEIIGSKDGGDSFILGNDLPAGSTNGTQTPGINPGTPNNGGVRGRIEQFMNQLRDMQRNFMNQVSQLFNKFFNGPGIGFNPYQGGNTRRSSWENDQRYDSRQHFREIGKAFSNLGRMFNRVSNLLSMTDRLFNQRRNMVAI